MTKRFLPWGTNAWLPEECARLRSAESKLRRLFVKAGAVEIATPAFEHLENLEKGFGHPEQFFHLTDSDGEALALRADLTTPAARLFATALAGKELPLRVFYIGQVFRRQNRHRGRLREFRQAGFECYGGDRAAVDREAVLLASSALLALGIRDFVLDLGHVGIVAALADEHALAGARRAAILDALARKDESALAEKGVPEVFRTLLTLPSESSSFAALKKLSRDPGFRKAVSELESLGRKLARLKGRVVFEFAAVARMDYYTGIVFEGFVSGKGRSVLSGGRYDRLTGEFGTAAPATGFSLELEMLLRS